jgi:hypothetical protein
MAQILHHGLQEIPGQLIQLPRDERLRPRTRLGTRERYAMFRKAG